MQRGRAESSADAGLIEWRRASCSSTSQSASRAAKEVAGADAAQGKARRLRRQCRRPRRGRQAKADGVAVASAPAQPGPSNGSVCWKCHIASVAIARMRPTPEAIKEADGLPIGIRSGIRRGGYGKGSYGKGGSGFGFGKGQTSQCIKASSQWCQSAPETCMRAYEMPELVLKTF